MKKFLVVFCLLILLAGCQSVDRNNVSTQLDRVFDSIENIGKYRINNVVTYYEYYLPSDMAEEMVDSDSTILKFNNSKVIMNLNISTIINNAYYPNHFNEDDGFFVEDYKIYEKTGTYKNASGNNKQYTYKLFDYKDQWVIHMFTSDMNYYGTVSKGDVKDLTKHLLTMAINTNVKIDDVINNYSKKDVIDYHKKQINLFDVALPINGELGAMLVDGAIIGDGILPIQQSEDIPYEYEGVFDNNQENIIEELPQE